MQNKNISQWQEAGSSLLSPGLGYFPLDPSGSTPLYSLYVPRYPFYHGDYHHHQHHQYHQNKLASPEATLVWNYDQIIH